MPHIFCYCLTVMFLAIWVVMDFWLLLGHGSYNWYVLFYAKLSYIGHAFPLIFSELILLCSHVSSISQVYSHPIVILQVYAFHEDNFVLIDWCDRPTSRILR